jgi:hypothetical protein
MPPGYSTWQYKADDGSDRGELCAGCSKEEYNTGEPFVANAIGTWQVLACADYQGSVLELNEGNNCTSSSFYVNPVGPDFIVSGLGLREGTSIKKD